MSVSVEKGAGEAYQLKLRCCLGIVEVLVQVPQLSQAFVARTLIRVSSAVCVTPRVA